MKILSLFVLLLFSVGARAFILNDVYHNGEEVCRLYSDQIGSEFSKLVKVPVDYEHPSLGQTEIYAYTKKPLDKSLPSLLFFTGGPGLSSRSSEFSLPHFNIIFFEQRGISCSRPVSREIFLNPKFYSSHNTARDAVKILDAFGLDAVTVFGHSYGTVPATIFSSLFPKRTRVLLLEGVVYHADHSLWLAKRRDQLLQNLFESLPAPEQKTILDLSKDKELPHAWFSQIGRMMLYLDNGAEAYRQFLESVFSNEFLDPKRFFAGFFPDPKKLEDEFGTGDVTEGMISCQEMSMSDPQMSFTTIFDKNNKLMSDHDNREREAKCRPIGLENYKGVPYQANLYPLLVPTVYLLGEDDGATPFDQALNHFNKVAQGPKQALVMTHGGHLPNLGLLKGNWDCSDATGCDSLKQNKLEVQIFEQLSGGGLCKESSLQGLLTDFNGAGNLKWTCGVERR